MAVLDYGADTLHPQLIKSQAITSASTFAEFYSAFNALPNFNIVDIGSTPPHTKAACISSHQQSSVALY